ncbi:hypothetical protein CBI38_24890 [Rhodococcus oxybenzonivorans]|uniref:Uncharacterized protein n=1 Tax=Rhodococcus oxybenzonivorans TaxID=1990687 RepID=A0A2S2C0B8_9NOCA|nr:hypothetical protein [Rhodococcus oxybenzonivorans]AWK74312.1 hypothetical protein CBI38_24890 [Rhodococcus oxybenzonivorans]
MVRATDFINQVVSSTLYRPDGTVETTRDPAVWTLAHRGYSGSGRLDVWAYRTQAAALRAGAVLAMEAGMDEDLNVQNCLRQAAGREVMERYEELSPEGHLLRVQAAFLQA